MRRLALAFALLTAVGGGSDAAPWPARPTIRREFRDRVSYQERRDVLSRKTMRGEEVVQHASGPCFLLSVVAGLQHAQPGFFESTFRERAGGKLSVRRFVKSRKTGRYETRWVAIDRALPRYGNGELWSAAARNKRVAWPALVEKMYAKVKGGYQTFADGGIPGEVMTLLTGKKSAYHSIPDLDADALWARMKRAHDEHKVMVAGTWASDKFRSAASRDRVRDARFHGALAFLANQDRPSYTGTGLQAGHAYSVWSVEESGGRRWVQVRDPEGYKHAADGAPSTERRSGIFWLPYEQFRALYEDVHIGG